MALSAEDRFNIELIKLLLRVAWSDNVVDKREALVLFSMGRSWNVPELELRALQEQLKTGGDLPEVDLEVLRTRPDDVLEAARALAASDGRLVDNERRLLEQIEAMVRPPAS
jgi:uncharacterized membrane protein YebE (DUF533 family)